MLEQSLQKGGGGGEQKKKEEKNIPLSSVPSFYSNVLLEAVLLLLCMYVEERESK